MKDLAIHLNIMVEEDDDNGPQHGIFEENLYLALSPEAALNDATRAYLVAVATRLVERALDQAKKEYQPELEVTP